MSNRAKTKAVKRYSSYSKEFKRKVCEEFIRGNKSKAEIKAQYNIKASTSIILDWLRKYGYIASLISSNSEFQVMAKPQEDTSKNLKKENEDLKLQLQMYKRMIEIAEKEFNIPIVKKSDTK